MKILLVEDEQKLVDGLTRGLKHYGYTVDAIKEGEEAYERITLYHDDYDLVILDLMLPGMDGISICKQIRQKNITIPMLILTARAETDTKVDLLRHGADDYLGKPFSLEELEARIQALLRRPAESMQLILKVNDIELNIPERKATKNGELIDLTQKEFALLEYFMRNAGRVISRDELLSHVWDFNYTSFFSNSVDVHIKNLRKKIENDHEPKVLETVRGVGYRFSGEVSA
jgi:DNA-binding response OmpR family regulator